MPGLFSEVRELADQRTKCREADAARVGVRVGFCQNLCDEFNLKPAKSSCHSALFAACGAESFWYTLEPMNQPNSALNQSQPSRVLSSMLDRLFASIMTGPAMNCRPQNSRQRIDLMSLGHLKHTDPAAVLHAILSSDGKAVIDANVTAPAAAKAQSRRRFRKAEPEQTETGEAAPSADAPERKAWNDQQSVLSKLRLIGGEAEVYEQDTGVDVLNIGFPLVSIPPGVPGPGGEPTTRRILAPICFLPTSIVIKAGAKASLELSCAKDDIDRIQPNQALIAWIEQSRRCRPEGLFSDEEGSNPWREIAELVQCVAKSLGLDAPAIFGETELPATIPLVGAPRRDDGDEKPCIVPAAVLGLFPVSNQGLLRDMREMLSTPEALAGPVRAFVRREPHVLEGSDSAQTAEPERLVTTCDPCQAQAVALARSSSVLVIHGPPGTGKSQTITNIIGDHLARGERVLFVCDKRTAIDVVANRLDAIGLGSLCAVVHDPQKDQKNLYLSVRAQLETLAETPTRASAAADIAKTDRELELAYKELQEYYEGLMHSPAAGGDSLTMLVGEWLALRGPATEAVNVDPTPLAGATLHDIEAATTTLREACERATHIDYPIHPWRTATQISLNAFLSRPIPQQRQSVDSLVALAQAADAALPDQPSPPLPAATIATVAATRGAVRDSVREVIATVPAPVRTFWAGKDSAAWEPAAKILAAAAPAAKLLEGFEPDPALQATLAAAGHSLATLAPQIAAIEQYLSTAEAWWGFLAFGKKAAAGKSLAPLGLPLNPQAAANALRHLKVNQACVILADAIARATGTPATVLSPADTAGAYAHHSKVLAALLSAAEPQNAHGCLDAARRDISGPATRELDRLAQQAAALLALHDAGIATGLLDADWLAGRIHQGFAEACCGNFQSLAVSFASLEDCLRVNEAIASLPASLSSVAAQLVVRGTDTAVALKFLRKGVLHAEIMRRLEASPRLRTVDARRIDVVFARVRELELQRQGLSRDLVLHRWIGRCKERLLVGTQTRLNSDGATLKQRLFVKGSKAMRLRQVIAMGAKAEGGDPLMDMRPVWMASPETVAQIFPREQIFDAVIFDEASQVRLEEALPVLTRAKRIIIAGDPKQLPPTRFFESALAETKSEAIESESDLFESVQADTEDLLSAALSMDVHQSYLDVHYRSHNADLIEFSNHHFYSARLQAIPGHPRNRATTPPLVLHEVGGVYEERANQIEAEAVVALIRDLLSKPNPPSIGVGCFNITQRDAISELLDDAAAEDKEFAAVLAAARSRRSEKSFEGLFVKNLENVQGDERDVIIISTTYGPDAGGKFYRRFGPLAQPGGGRRLNVLVTRARTAVHIVTSIPPAVYVALPPVPEGAAPGGAYLLFSYLKFAAALRDCYGEAKDYEAERRSEELVHKRVTIRPSPLAEAVAEHLAEQSKLSSTVYWGNEGFCMDIATPSPDGGATAPLGILTDFSRFGMAGDPVKWDIFRSGMLLQLGWNIQRIWTPSIVRDPEAVLTLLAQKAKLPQS